MKLVLVIDDNAAIRMVISDYLKMSMDHVQVLQAADGVEGLAMVQSQPPDLILLDGEMPNMNGYEVAQQLRHAQETQHIPIIAISSGISSNPVISGLRHMSDMTLPKPFTPDELVSAVRQVCDNRHVSA